MHLLKVILSLLLSVCNPVFSSFPNTTHSNIICLLMKILISGGGIAGLTVGLAAKKAGHLPLIVEQRNALDIPTFGGGIGLWPPSQMVMERLGVLGSLEDNGLYMPSACYYDSKANVLAHPSTSFSRKFPVLCLEREQLLKILYKKCLQEKIEIKTQAQLVDAKSLGANVKAELNNGEDITVNLLVGADGIGSKVRGLIMKEHGRAQILPHHCQYAYYRAVVELETGPEGQWHRHAFESWGHGKRFGYVPLKSPKVFWFVAIPIGEGGLQKRTGSHLCSASQKRWILELLDQWKGPINIKQLIQKTPFNTILRTDICKIKDVTSFPWASKNSNMLILGDAANATAPNLAQGAGLAIQSAWDFVTALQQGHNFHQYIEKRKKRAETVQSLADLVAQVGQLPKPWSSIRNFVMSNSTNLARPLQQRIFEKVVSYSLGGDSQKLNWLPSSFSYLSDRKQLRQTSCLLGRIVGAQNFSKLPKKTKVFRQSLIGSGQGKVSVASVFFAKILGLPTNMKEVPFGAYCETLYGENGVEYQIWTRVFGEGQRNPTKYSTIHRSTPALSIFEGGLSLTESLGVNLDIFRFGYMPIFQNGGLLYKSKGLWLKNYKLPFPQVFLPTSEWTEKYSENGWSFRGKISLPGIIGGFPLMKYEGTFQPTICSEEVTRKQKIVVIAGGTGLIGSKVARAFYLAGWNVEILSRKGKKLDRLPFAKVHKWSPSQHNSKQEVERISRILQRADLVINLSGENPGSGLWTTTIKNRILESRLASIRALHEAMKMMKTKVIPVIQASAAGIYGNKGSQVLLDGSHPGDEITFRVNTCKQIQQLAQQCFSSPIILRIGHVFSSEGGLLPHLNLASLLRVKQLGSGGQYAPWLHIEDLSQSMVHIGEKLELYQGQIINVASPQHQTYTEILQKLAAVRGRRGCIVNVPESILKSVLGEISSVLLDSQRMHPQILLQNQFQFKYGNLEEALTSRDCL